MNSANYINHIGIVMDMSESMQPIQRPTVQVVDEQIRFLAESSKTLDQETRVTVYTFNTRVRCVHYDKDVLRTPSLAQDYRPDGMTALIDASVQAIEEMQQTATLYGDHAFLLYVITDGAENRSRRTADALRSAIRSLPDNWTVATLVPNMLAARRAEEYGFPPGNIQIWETTEKGMRDVGDTLRRTTTTYMTNRSSGVRSYSGLFSMDTQNLTPSVVSGNLHKLSPNEYTLVGVAPGNTLPIRDFVEQTVGVTYIQGMAYYQLTKTEEIQNHKQIAVRDKNTGAIYTGQQARDLLGLPVYTVKVAPGKHPQFDIFVQSTSVNRKLVPNTQLLVMN